MHLRTLIPPPVLSCLLGLLLAGCQLESDKPLLPLAGGAAALGDGFVAAMWSGAGPVPEEDGAVTLISGRFDGGSYVLDGQDVWRGVSVHQIRGRDELRLLQVIDAKSGGASYYFGRVRGRDLEMFAPRVDKARRAELHAAGLRFVEEGGSGVKLDTPVELWRFVGATLARDELDAAEAPLVYRFATTPAEQRALRAAAAEAECLALAGHPQDPAVAAMPGKHAAGRWMNAIDAAAAEPACRRALAQRPSASVRYALARALFLKEKAAETRGLVAALVDEGFGPALAMQADILANGRLGARKDPEAARRLLATAAGRGDPMGAYLLGYYETYGSFGTRDYSAARDHLKTALEAGVRGAATQLGILYEGGYGVVANPARAVRYYRQGVDETDLEAHYRLGRMLYYGEGVDEDREAAFKLFEAAAERQHAAAAYFAGFMLARGQGVKQNAGKAVRILEPAADAGSTAAQAELGRLVYHGEGVAADRVRGRKLLEKAAEAGDETAAAYLAAIDKPKPTPDLYGENRQRDGAPPKRDGPMEDLQALLRGEPFRLTPQNVPFMAGVASALAETCDAPRDLGDRWELARFAMTATVGSIFGGKYSDPDLGAALGDAGKRLLLQGMGEAAGRKIPCGTVAEAAAAGILAAMRSNASGADGGVSTFVRTCAPAFDQRRCSCLANTARVTMPEIHRMAYDRTIIKRVVEGNPFIGLQIALTCGINEY
ncbi:hypothetical protein GE300_00250 [Rhodobacteraceae bacterium 2CG4]|uniref:TPR repeat protein n=1 Tax=Halovulum marinum TaxID=2662447 RepID=A0A6L5YUN3_9RHOB|nr:tetratricopeptide repeat protein [Halovulum marinum]MSU88043.1 hypothetical protein [Halovulum marinum]